MADLNDSTPQIPQWQQAPEVPQWQRAPLASPPPGFEIVSPPPGFEVVSRDQPPDAPFAMPQRVADAMRASLRSAPPGKVKDFAGALEAGFESSVAGLALRGKLPDVQLDPDAPWYARMGANVSQVAGDLPAMAAGAILGGAAGAETGPGAAITAAGGAMALSAGMRATLMDAYASGDLSIRNWGDFWNRSSAIMWDTAKGWLTGAATGAAGAGATAVLPLAAPAAVRVAAPTAAELAAMVTVGNALEGHVPAAQDFVDAAIVLGGLKAAGSIAPVLRNIYARTGKSPAEVIADARTEPSIAKDLGADGGVPPAPDSVPKAYDPLAAAERMRQIVPGDEAAEVARSPFADVPQAAGEPALPTHVNYGYIGSTDDAAMALSRLSSIYEDRIQAQRRGSVSWDATSADAARLLADTLGQSDATLLMPREPGTAAGAAEILARKQLTIGAAEDMATRAREYLAKQEAGQASADDQLQFLASIERAGIIQSEFLGARAEAGRALNILKSTARDAERAQQVQDVIRLYGGNPEQLARQIAELDTAAGALKFARDAVQASTYEKVIEAWKSGLLSGPVTHMANIIGNTTFMAMRVPIDLVAAGFGKLHGGDRVAAAEPMARLAGILQGSVDGLRVGYHVLRTGERAAGKSEQYRAAIGTAEDSSRAARMAGQVVRVPYRLLSAADEIFQTMNSRAEAHTLAVREAVAEGLSPATREFRERVVSLVQNPTPEMSKAIDAAAERFTFNTPLGDFGQKLQGVVKRGHLEFIMPFVRTPTNIAKELARMTPFAPALKEWRDDFKAGGARRDKAYAELSVGTAILSTTFMFALDGRISGAGEPDAGKRRIQRAAGWQPYSVKIGDTWYSYQRIQPLGTLMGLAADAAEVWDHMTEEEHDLVPKMLAVAFANAVTNQTFLQGVTNVVNAVSDPNRSLPSLANGFARSWVPNLIGQTTEMHDPLARQVDGMLDSIKSRIPGLREQLLPKRDVFGEPIASTERIAGIMPVTTSTESSDKVRTEAARLNVSAGDAPTKTHVGRGTGKLGSVDLTPQQRDVFSDTAGHMAHQVLTQIVNSPAWDNLPDLVQRRIYSKVFLQARRAGAAAALPPEQRGAIVQEIVQKLETELTPERPDE